MADPTVEEQAKIIQDILSKTGKNFSTLGPVLERLLGPFQQLISATASGATGMAAYNAALDKLPASIEKLSAILGPVGDAFRAVGAAGMEYVKAVNLQNDELYKSYQVLAKTGLAGEANTDSLLKTAQQFGVVSDTQLPQFSKMLESNSEMLAKFGGTAAQGVTAFANISENIQRTGVQTQLLAMGMSIESINAGTAGFLKTQQMSGAAMQRAGEDQKAYTARMSAGAEDYIKQMDILSKLTGKSAEAQQKEMEERLNDERYAIHHRELTMKANAGDLEAKKQLEEENKILQQTTGDVQKGFRAAFTGYGMQTEEGRKLFMAAPEAFKQAAAGVGVEANKILDTAKGEFGKTLDTFGQLYMAAGNNFTSNVADMIKVTLLKGTAAEREKAAEDAQKTQIEKTHESIKVQIATIQLQREAQKDLQNMLHAGSTAVGYFMLKLTEAYRLEGTSRLPGAEGFKGMSAAEIEAERAKLQLQRLSQGVGGPPLDRDKGETEGTRKSRQEDAGLKQMKPTESMIERRAVEELNIIVPGMRTAVNQVIDDLLKEVAKGAVNGATDAAKEAAKLAQEQIDRLRLLLQDNQAPRDQRRSALDQVPTVASVDGRPMSLTTTSEPVASVDGRPMSLTTTSELLAATVNRGTVNIASVENIGFPQMPTSFRSSLDPDMMSQIITAGFSTARETKTESTTTPRDSELIASNVVVSQKLDDLIEIMRRGVGIQDKTLRATYNA